MGATLALSFVAFLLLFVWMLINRYRIEVLKESLEGAEMEVAIRERVAEAGTSGHLELPADLRVPVSGG